MELLTSRLAVWRGARIAAVMTLALTGCAGRHINTATSQPAAPQESNAELMTYISDQPYVSADAAYRAVYVLWKGTAFQGDFAALSSTLEGGRVVSPLWKLEPDAYIIRATAAYMLARAIGLQSGLNWQLTGLGRYAWRELQFRGIAGSGGELGLVSGGEFLGMLSRADAYMQKGSRAPAAVDLGPQPN